MAGCRASIAVLAALALTACSTLDETSAPDISVLVAEPRASHSAPATDSAVNPPAGETASPRPPDDAHGPAGPTASATTGDTASPTSAPPTSPGQDQTDSGAAGAPTVDPTASEPEQEPVDELVDELADEPPPNTEPAAPECVVEVGTGESLDVIVATLDDASIDVAGVVAENELTGPDVAPGQRLDVCVDNGLDDITGTARGDRSALFVDRERATAVAAQQERLNVLFAGYGIEDLLVDGISGSVTRQRLCAFRLAAGLRVSTADMEAGSVEEQVLMATTALPVPFSSALLSERWILIDRTCQIMFVGTGRERLDFVFPTSTGQPGFGTRTQNRSPVFRYNPASDNGGWHDSTSYPSTEDNPLNGNMYRPLYFDGGQAIHGANNVPRAPASHGCARLRVRDQDALVEWLGLDGASYTTDRSRINATVSVQGTWSP